MREVLEKFDFENTIAKLDEGGLLFKVMERFRAVDLHPDKGVCLTFGAGWSVGHDMHCHYMWLSARFGGGWLQQD